MNQGDAQEVLQPLYLVADGGLRDVQLVGGVLEALVPGGGFERPDGGKGWQSAFHSS